MSNYLDLKTLTIFAFAIIIHIGAWMLRLFNTEFNPTSLLLGLAILATNFALAWLFTKKGFLIGYILSLSALFVQIVAIIPIIKAGLN